MQKIVSAMVRVIALVAHIAQAVTSFTSGLYVSGVIGASLIGAQLYSPKTFKRVFNVSPWVVSGIGSILWLFVAVVELW